MLTDQLPQATPRLGWPRVIVPEGEPRKEGDALGIYSEHIGRKRVEVLNFKLE